MNTQKSKTDELSEHSDVFDSDIKLEFNWLVKLLVICILPKMWVNFKIIFIFRTENCGVL